MDLFLKISVLQANFCWLGDLRKIICPWMNVSIEGVWGDLTFWIAGICQITFSPPPPPTTAEEVNFPLRRHPKLLSYPPPPPPPTTEGLTFALWSHPNWPLRSGHTIAGKLPSKSGCRCTLLAGNSSISFAGWRTDKFFLAISQNA